jgi:hypothetical protein
MIPQPLAGHNKLSLSATAAEYYRFLLAKASASQLLAVPLLVRRKESLQGLGYRSRYSPRPLMMRIMMNQFLDYRQECLSYDTCRLWQSSPTQL